jgi:N-acyl-L-homoserine lactone synthetase
MVLVVDGARRPLDNRLVRAMFEARKQVFVDLLKWDVPVLEDRFELDQFDDAHAVYLIAAGPQGEHLGSARLLQTVRPHILGTLFADLCEGGPRRGPDILEVTRFCLDRNQDARRRLATRNRLVGAIVDYALAHAINRYVGIAELGWLQQILAFGWRCRPLGMPRPCDGRMIGAFSVEITPDTPALLARSGIYVEETPASACKREAA